MMLKRLAVVAVMTVAALGACRHSNELEDKKGETLCPESQELTCISGKDCTMDRERGCQRCECSRGDALTPTDNRIPAAMQPPDRAGPIR